MKGRSSSRPELAEAALPFEVSVTSVPCRGGEGFLRSLFEPLGYRVEAERIPLDEAFPEWGDGVYFSVRLAGVVRLEDLLTHLYVLLPVLDDKKHYWIDRDEIEKLLDEGGAWLKSHPLRETISRRYLRHQKHLVRDALERLMAEDDPEPSETESEKHTEEASLERPLSLNDQRLGAVVAALKEAGASRVVDLGCGEGRLLAALLKEPSIRFIRGVDVSPRSLAIAKDRLKLDRLPEARRRKIELVQGALTYRDGRFGDCDAACAVEVIEHIDPPRLAAFERVVFEHAKPRTVVITTPNVEYNLRFESLPAGRLRHRDHRFEWTRAEFRDWCSGVAERHGYEVRFAPIGPEDPELGAPTPSTPCPRISNACALDTWGRSDRSPCGSTRSASKRFSASSRRSPSTASTSASSAFSRSRASPSTRGSRSVRAPTVRQPWAPRGNVLYRERQAGYASRRCVRLYSWWQAFFEARCLVPRGRYR